MAVHDTIGDFLTVIRNAGSAGRPSCLYPHSKLRSGIASILKSRGFVEKFDELESDKGLKQIEIHLKYVNGEHAIRGISRMSFALTGFLTWGLINAAIIFLQRSSSRAIRLFTPSSR